MEYLNQTHLRGGEDSSEVVTRTHGATFVVEVDDCPWRSTPSADNKIECCKVRYTTFRGPDERNGVVLIVPEVQME